MGTTNFDAIQLEAGQAIKGIFFYSVTWNPASVAAATSAEQTVTVNGLQVGDVPVLVKPTLSAGLGIGNVRVSAANTLAVTLVNATAGAIDAGSEVYTLMTFRPA